MTSKHTSEIVPFPADRRSATAETGAPSDGAGATIVPLRQARLAAGMPAYDPSAEAKDSVLGWLWNALSEDRLVMHYQPQYDFLSARIPAAEALVRILDESGELVFPDAFIVEAEQSGLIVPLGRAVIEHVCRDLAAWRRDGLELERVAINLSAHQLNADPLLAEFVHETLENHGLAPEDLEFELTERQVLRRDGIGMRTLRVLNTAGSRLALDDFGIGYSSVAYLTDLPIAAVKIDRDMVARLPYDARTLRIIRNLTNLALDLGLEIVAEGIETSTQDDLLRLAGCSLGQGYFRARPMPADDLRQRLSA